MSKMPPKMTRRPATSQAWAPAATAATQAIPNPIRVRALGVRPTRASPRPMGSAMARTGSRSSGETNEPLTRRPAPFARPDRRPRARDWRAAYASNASGTMVWTVSRPWRRAVTSPISRSLLRCHETSGWDSPTCSMSSVTVAGPPTGAGRSAAGWRPRGPCGTSAARAGRRGRRRRTRWCCGCGRGRGTRGGGTAAAGGRAVASTTVYINGR